MLRKQTLYGMRPEMRIAVEADLVWHASEVRIAVEADLVWHASEVRIAQEADLVT